jgi:CheY-like chemotaxis protein
MERPILIIEDNEQNRYLATYLLEQHGYRVVTASDGPTGILEAGRVGASMILLDIQLPLMDGYAVARALRENPALAATPIIAVTSYAMPGDREKALDAGCTGYLEKPIDPTTFLESLRSYGLPSEPRAAS